MRFDAIDPASRFALGAYLIARIFLTVWSLVIATLFPIMLQNLDLFGTPTIAVFDLTTGERYAYSRVIEGKTLFFRLGDGGHIVDVSTNSEWSLQDGRALSGPFAGQALTASNYSVEEIFPYRGAPAESNIFLSVWQRFDTNWYLKLASRGYAADDGSTVYFPLYPFLIRVVTLVTNNTMFSSLLISNLAAIGVLFLLYRLTERCFDANSAKRAVAYLLIFPTGFFLLAAYTESLFLLLALGAFVTAQRERWWLSALLGMLAAFTRLQGVLMIIPLVYILWRQFYGTKSPRRLSSFAWRSLALGLIPLATIAFLTFTNLSLITSYEGELNARFVLPWKNIIANLVLFQMGQGTLIDGLNLLSTIGFGAMLFIIWKKLPLEYTLYLVAMFLAPLFRMTTTQPLVSMSRYMLMLFPVFMLWGVAGKNSWINRLVLYLSFPLQMYLSAQFILWGWVA